MALSLAKTAKTIIDFPLDLMLSRDTRMKVGRHILDRAAGDNEGDPALNGEYHVVERVKQKLRGKSATVFDVGANVGDWTVEFARGMSSDLTLYCFEPCQGTFQTLDSAIAKAAVQAKVVPNQAALSDHDGEATLFTGEDGAGTNTLHSRYGSGIGFTSSAKVKLLRGDDFCAANGIDRINFLKIDSEGHEVQILRGFEKMLAEARIDCIQFEYNNTWIDSRMFLADAFALLCPRGYVMGKIHPGGLQVLSDYDQRLERFQFANYLAMRPEWAPVFHRIS